MVKFCFGGLFTVVFLVSFYFLDAHIVSRKAKFRSLEVGREYFIKYSQHMNDVIAMPLVSKDNGTLIFRDGRNANYIYTQDQVISEAK